MTIRGAKSLTRPLRCVKPDIVNANTYRGDDVNVSKVCEATVMAAGNDPKAALAGMAQVGNPRVPMGDSAYAAPKTYGSSPNTTLRKKGGAQSADPTPPTGRRKGTQYPLPAGSGDRDGAAYRVSVRLPGPSLHEASATQANGRVIRPAVQRQYPNFNDEANGAGLT